MDECPVYPEFEYSQLIYFGPPAPAGSLFYEGLIERLLKKVVPSTNTLEHHPTCWEWQGNKQRLISHKYLGMMPIRTLSFALYLPEEYNKIYNITKNRMRLKFLTKCGNDDCIRPEHMIVTQTQLWRALLYPPQQRSEKTPRDEWLNFREMSHLGALIHCSVGDPERVITKFADRIQLPFHIVADIWESYVMQWKEQMKEWSCLRST